jgi:hypothetical protein
LKTVQNKTEVNVTVLASLDFSLLNLTGHSPSFETPNFSMPSFDTPNFPMPSFDTLTKVIGGDSIRGKE